MKKILPVLGYLAVLATLVFGIGLLRPREQSARVVGVIRLEPERVWPTLFDAGRWAEWLPPVDRMRTMPEREGNPVWKASGGWGDFEVELTAVKEPYQMNVLIDSEKFSGQWAFDLEPVPAGTRLTITETGEVQNPFFRGLSLFSNPRAEMLETIEALGVLHDTKIAVEEVELESGV